MGKLWAGYQLSAGYGLGYIGSLWASYGLSAVHGLDMDWLWTGYGLAVDWLWAAIYWLAISWLLAIYQLAINCLSAGYGPKSIHFKTQSYTMYQCCIWLQAILYTVVVRSQDLLAISWLSAGYQLAIGWLWPQVNTHQDIVIYYYWPKLSMTAINTLDCRVLRRFVAIWWLFVGCLLAGYWLATYPNQHTSRQSHTLLCNKVAHGCSKCFGL